MNITWQWLSIFCSTSMVVAIFLVIRYFLWRHIRPLVSYAVGILLVVAMLIPIRPAWSFHLVDAPGSVAQTPQPVVTEMEPAQHHGVTDPDGAFDIGGGTILAEDAVSQPVASPFSQISTALVFVWAAGAVCLLAIQLTRHTRFERAVRRLRVSPAFADRAILENACLSLGITRRPSIWRCKLISTPMVIGLRKPAILLPDSTLDDTALEPIIRHELVHLKRHDLWLKLPILLALCIHWYNPLMWLLVRAISADCEMACDEAVLAGMDMGARKRYGSALLHTMRQGSRLYSPLSACFHFRMPEVNKRFVMLLNRKKRRCGKVFLVLMMSLVLLTGNVFGAALLSPTTGLPYAPARGDEYRPVLVHLGNDTQANPLYGISRADVVYQFIYWGPNQTQYLALFNDNHPETVGAIQPGRYFDANIRQEWDCPIVYERGIRKVGIADDDFVIETDRYMQTLGVSSGLIFTLQTYPGMENQEDKTINLQKVVQHWPDDENGEAPHTPRLPALRFSQQHTTSKIAATDVQVVYGNPDEGFAQCGGEITYKYDEAVGGYLRYVDGMQQVDGLNGTPVTATNILVQWTAVAYPDNDVSLSNPEIQVYGQSGRLDAYINGYHVEGTWSRESLQDQTHYYDSNGTELLLAPGKTFIQVMDAAGDIPVPTVFR